MPSDTYLNSYVAPALQPWPAGFGLETPANKYDHNFNGKHVTDLSSNQVYLQPLTPILHARKLAELCMAYPEGNKYMNYQPESLEDVLHWMETNRRAPSNRVTWALYHLTASEQEEYSEPPLDRLAGFVGLYAFDPDRLVAALGPLVVFKPFQRSACATHAAWLMQSFAFEVLGCYRLHAWAQVDNIAPQGLGKKLGYSKEAIYRGHWNYINWSHVVACEEWLKENPGKDIRTKEKTADWGDASIRWDTYRDIYHTKVIHAHLNLDSKKVYQNSYIRPPAVKPIPVSDVKGVTDLEDYDFNFAGLVRDLRCKSLYLVPFVPVLHGKTLHDIISNYPGPIDDHLTSQSERFESYEGTLRYFETIRRDEKQFAWVIYDASTVSDHGTVSINDVIGFAAIKNMSVPHRWVMMGPVMIKTSHQGKGLDMIASALIMNYVMLAQPSGLGYYRIEWSVPLEQRKDIELAKELGFVAEGDTYFVHAPGWKHNADQALAMLQYPSLDRGNDFDPRQTLHVHRRWVGSVVWKDWNEGGVKEKIDRILDGGLASGTEQIDTDAAEH